MEVEIVVPLARARVREKRERGTEFDHLLGVTCAEVSLY
jgi:hypothetical protein